MATYMAPQLRGGRGTRPMRLLALLIAAVAVRWAAQAWAPAVAFVIGRPAMPQRHGLKRSLRAGNEVTEEEEPGEVEAEPELTEEELEELREKQISEERFQKLMARKGVDLDGDKLDNLEEWYQEGVQGKGGKPEGFMRDLVFRSFYGKFSTKGWMQHSRIYTGKDGRPCDADYETAYETLKTTIQEGAIYVGKDDGQGWTWLVATQNPGGIGLYLSRLPPFGERPLALIKNDKPDEFFENVDWERLYIRLHKWQLWGGKATKFPFVVKGGLPSEYRPLPN